MVTGKGGGGVVRRKVGVRKQCAVREGNILVGSETNAAAGQRPVAVRGGGRWCRRSW